VRDAEGGQEAGRSACSASVDERSRPAAFSFFSILQCRRSASAATRLCARTRAFVGFLALEIHRMFEEVEAPLGVGPARADEVVEEGRRLGTAAAIDHDDALETGTRSNSSQSLGLRGPDYRLACSVSITSPKSASTTASARP
jgi:hypothetical protein